MQYTLAILFSALILGLMGSFHCAGMCGPIAIALPLPGSSFFQKISGGFLYNIGRTITYAIMGAIFGWLGQGLHMIGFQQKISVIMGSLMIVSALFPSLFKNHYKLTKSWFTFVGALKSVIGKMFSIHTYFSLFIIGLLNGLLPCGLVYMAIAGAIGTQDVALGSAFMFLFGMGTIPMLLGISIAGNLMGLTVRNKIHKLIPFLIVLVGIFFILRGLSLGIPFLSPPKEKIEMKFEKSLKDQQTASVESNKYLCSFDGK